MENQPVYVNDYFGLRTLHEQGITSNSSNHFDDHPNIHSIRPPLCYLCTGSDSWPLGPRRKHFCWTSIASSGLVGLIHHNKLVVIFWSHRISRCIYAITIQHTSIFSFSSWGGNDRGRSYVIELREVGSEVSIALCVDGTLVRILTILGVDCQGDVEAFNHVPDGRKACLGGGETWLRFKQQ